MIDNAQFFSVVIKNRDEDPQYFPALEIKPKRYKRSYRGGPAIATLEVRGSEYDLFQCLGWLRYYADINHAKLRTVWYGLITDVELHIRNKVYAVSLDRMANRIKVVYAADGQATETDWAEDATSVAAYGTKEMVSQINETTAEGAEAKRDRILSETSSPRPRMELVFGSQTTEAYAIITCRGVYSTLAWERLSINLGSESYTDEDSAYYQAFGWGNGTTPPYVTYVAQSFQLLDTVPWNAHTIAVNLTKYGSPADLVLGIYSDSAGNPGSLLDTATIAAADVPTWSSFGWVEKELTNHYELQPATTYHIRAGQNGANQTDHHYRMHGNNALGYTRGSAKMYFNGSWTGLGGNDQDFLFRIYGTRNNATLMEYMLDDVAPQFITGVSITGTTSAKGNPARTNNTTYLAELEELLVQGTDDGRQYLVRVNADRSITIEPEPAKTTIAYYIDSTNQLLDTGEQVVDWAVCPAGVWVKAKDAPPPGVALATYEDPSVQFIEECEYDVASGRPTVTMRGVPDPFGG